MTSPVALAVLPRLAVLIAVDVVASGVSGWKPKGDADIGWGLLMLGVSAVIAALWGGWDGWRRPVLAVAKLWTVVGLLYGVAVVLRIWLTEPGDGRTFPWQDLVVLVPVGLVLVAVPAIVAAALVGAFRGSAPEASRSR